MKLLLIRHSITIYNLERRYQGWGDIPLCQRGKDMLQPKTVWKDEPTEVYVSPLIRARQTAQILFPDANQQVVEEFREMNFGTFEGYTSEELADHPEYQPWVDGMCQGRCPGGEDLQTFQRRCIAGFTKVVATEAKQAVIVAHGGTQMTLLHQFGHGHPEYYSNQLPPGFGYELEWDGKELSILQRIDFTKGAEACVS